MYGDNKQIPEMMKKLATISPTVCLAKWFHCTLHLGTGKTHSCYLPQTHKIPLKEIKKDVSALHNTQYKMKQRKTMLEGERPKECKICWDIEDLPGEHYSDRHYRSVESWTKDFWEDLKIKPWNASIMPKYLELSFSNVCNLKCTYCSPAASTQWYKEIKKEGAYPLASGKYNNLLYFKAQGEIPLPEDDNPYLDAFMKWWPEVKKELMYLRITGGEPLLSQATFDLLEEINQGEESNLNISVNSNLCIKEQVFSRFKNLVHNLLETNKIREHILHVSVDTYGSHAEYIRDGLDFELLEKNVNSYMNEVPKGSLAIMCTFNNLSLIDFQRFLQWVMELRKKYQNKDRNIFLDIPHLQFPTHQSVKILPEEFHKYMLSHIRFMEEHQDPEFGFRAAEVAKMQRILDWMKQPLEDKNMTMAQKDFYLFFKEKDRRRSTDLIKTFPEMKTFYESCESLC
jgi:organic radical activating enzyme